MQSRSGRSRECSFATKEPWRCLPFKSISYLPEMRFGGTPPVSDVSHASIHTLPWAMLSITSVLADDSARIVQPSVLRFPQNKEGISHGTQSNLLGDHHTARFNFAIVGFLQCL